MGADRPVVAPTVEEALRVKAFLVVQRNAVRDHLDVVALADAIGLPRAVEVLQGIDGYDDDRSGVEGSVLTHLVLALADPAPRDADVIGELHRYRGLDPQWHDWDDVVATCQELALLLGGAA